MRRRRVWAAAVLVWLAAILVGVPVFAARVPPDTFSIVGVSVGRDRVTAHVHTSRAAPVDPGSFAALVDGRPVGPVGVRGTEGGAAGPGAVALVLDRSPSIQEEPVAFASTAEGAQALLRALPEGVPVHLVAFAEHVKSERFGDREEALSAVEGAVLAGSGTALWDALLAGVEAVSAEAAARRAVVAFTDGCDNRSRVGPDEVAAALVRAGASLLVVGYAGTGGLDDAALQRLAERSGGAYVRAASPEAVVRAFSWVAGRIEAQYDVWVPGRGISPGEHVLTLQAQDALGLVCRAERVFLMPAAGAANPFAAFWDFLTRRHDAAWARKLSSVPVVGRVLGFLVDMFLGVSPDGGWSVGSVALAMLLNLLWLLPGAGLAGRLALLGKARRLLNGAAWLESRLKPVFNVGRLLENRAGAGALGAGLAGVLRRLGFSGVAERVAGEKWAQGVYEWYRGSVLRTRVRVVEAASDLGALARSGDPGLLAKAAEAAARRFPGSRTAEAVGRGASRLLGREEFEKGGGVIEKVLRRVWEWLRGYEDEPGLPRGPGQSGPGKEA